MAFDPKPEVFLKDQFSFFTVDELTAANALFVSADRARAEADDAFARNDGSTVLLGDMYAALAAVSPSTAERMADLLDEPIEVVYAIRDELLDRLARAEALGWRKDG